MKMNTLTTLLAVACLGSGIASPIRSYAITETELKGKSLVFAETVTTTSQVGKAGGKHTTNIYLRIGHYDFGSSTTSVQLNYFLFDAQKNKISSPHKSILRPNAANTPRCHPWKIQRPVYDKYVAVKGIWEVDGPFVRVTIDKTVHEWRQDKSESTHFRQPAIFDLPQFT